VEVVAGRLAGDEVVVVQGDALCMTAARRTQMAILTAISNDRACPTEQAVVERAVFMIPGEQGEEHIVIVWVTHTNLVIERLFIFDEQVSDW
jgi:hypothetical protein